MLSGSPAVGRKRPRRPSVNELLYLVILMSKKLKVESKKLVKGRSCLTFETKFGASYHFAIGDYAFTLLH
jgi:hypothetical protein